MPHPLDALRAHLLALYPDCRVDEVAHPVGRALLLDDGQGCVAFTLYPDDRVDDLRLTLATSRRWWHTRWPGVLDTISRHCDQMREELRDALL